MKRQILPFIALSLLCTSPAFAYVGPGVGLGVFGTLFGIFAAVALALFGLFWYPLKRAFGKKSASNNDQNQTPSDESAGGSNPQ